MLKTDIEWVQEMGSPEEIGVGEQSGVADLNIIWKSLWAVSRGCYKDHYLFMKHNEQRPESGSELGVRISLLLLL